MDLSVHWKQEPVSPLSYEDVYLSSDETFYQTTDYEDVVKQERRDFSAACESKAAIASHILQDLENLMDLDDLIKDEEPFLLDVKMLPMLEEVEPPRAVPVTIQDEQIKLEFRKQQLLQQQQQQQQPDTQSLLHEFQSVYDVVGFAHGALTPPQSPPTETPLLISLEPLKYNLKQQTATTVPEKQHLLPIFIGGGGEDYNNAVQQPTDIAHELAVVDELVRTRVEDMHWLTTTGPCSPSSSSSSSSSSSTSSNCGDCSSDDPEWVPEPVDDHQDSTTIAPSSSAARKRSKPYSRNNPDEKKSRKKEQNKNAATRYRLKKKAEVEEILTEEKQLLDKNTSLGSDITDLQREIKYLKGLMRDLFKAKGLIN